MSLVNIKIEGQPYQVEAGLTILEAAKACGYEIPSLCAFNHGECNQGSCRVCLVEATGARGLVASCVYPVAEGMEIKISSPAAVQARRRSVELMLSNHNKNCQQCDKNGQCELLHVAQITGAREDAFQGVHSETHIDTLGSVADKTRSKHIQECLGMGAFKSVIPCAGHICYMQQFAVSVLIALLAVLIVIGKQKLDAAAACLNGGLASNMNIHSLTDRVNTAGYQAARSGNLNEAHPAGSGITLPMVKRAQRRYLISAGFCSLQNRLTVLNLIGNAFNFDIYL